MEKYSTREFKEKLEEAHKFPTLYMFKFIVPDAKKEEVKALFPRNEVNFKPSSKGTYVSITVKAMMASSDAVIEIYKQASQIEGILAL
jgi:putative lipoic acid-binding regulatory protein